MNWARRNCHIIRVAFLSFQEHLDLLQESHQILLSWFSLFPRAAAQSTRSPAQPGWPQRQSAQEASGIGFSFAHCHNSLTVFKKMIMYSNPKKCLCLKKKKKKSGELRTRASALSLSVKLQSNYCLLRGAVKHNQSESLKDTISLFTNCLLVNSKSPPCFKSTNHRAVMNSN